MIRRFNIILVSIVAVSLATVSSLSVPVVRASTLPVLTQQPTEINCYEANLNDVVETVNAAIDLMVNQGADIAFRQLMDPSGGFVKGDLYVFVLDFQGVILAHGAEPRAVGASALESRDRNGHYFIRDMLSQAATRGDGWIGYHMVSPCTDKLALKQVFFKRAGAFVVGAGFYSHLGS